jgi:hypothetical protein
LRAKYFSDMIWRIFAAIRLHAEGKLKHFGAQIAPKTGRREILTAAARRQRRQYVRRRTKSSAMQSAGAWPRIFAAHFDFLFHIMV